MLCAWCRSWKMWRNIRASSDSIKNELKCCCPFPGTCSCIVRLIRIMVTCPVQQWASPPLSSLDNSQWHEEDSILALPPLTVMEVGCCLSAFLPTLASLVNWHHLLNGIAWVCKLLLQLSLIIKLDEWNWRDWSPVEQKHNRRRKD